MYQTESVVIVRHTFSSQWAYSALSRSGTGSPSLALERCCTCRANKNVLDMNLDQILINNF